MGSNASAISRCAIAKFMGMEKKKAMRWERHWTELPEAASYSGLLQRSCKKGAADAASV